MYTNYEDFKAELLQSPEIRKEYEALKPKYEKIKNRLYPTIGELKEQAEYLNKLPKRVYEMFERQGIPPAIAQFIKRKIK